MVNLPDKLTSKPIHRYGVDSFVLYNLPIPSLGRVVGILGRNGIGKSTTIKILAGVLKPNVGEPESEGKDITDLIHMFKGTEIQQFLERVKKGKVTVSYKPQAVNLIPKQIKGKVKDLLKKADQKGEMDRMVKELEIENILGNDIADISGGEMQRVAVAAAALKKANVYFFDEPSSFLDITARMKVARLIRSLATPETSVLVIEHDLATLDYISDQIHIVYGDPAVYGIISQPKPVRRAINEYLDGYLPDDNIRFRKYKITFEQGIIKVMNRPKLFDWPELKKSFEHFSLTINPGEIQIGEILTITGANGLGKTTFLKMIAGLVKPDEGELKSTLKIAYKPQYIQPEKGTVEEWLKKSATNYNSGWFQKNILEKLNLENVLKSTVDSLSGGELQKLFIAVTLAQDADIYAFDEPSAFIDVEDRLKVAEVIKEFMIKKDTCAIVVDHDVQFLDYIGDSMLVFFGEPGKVGNVKGPLRKEEGMNEVLKMLEITYRMDKQTKRPRINKSGSQLDKQQKKEGKYYYN